MLIDPRTPRLLVISTNRWPMVGKLASALAVVGFHVAVVCPTDSPVSRITKICAHFRYRPWISLRSIRHAIATWSSDVLVCTDDVAVRELHSLYFEASQKSDKRDCRELMTLIETSLGDPLHFAKAELKSQVLMVAESLGIACPKTEFLSNTFALERQINKVAFPVLIKADKSFGGRGVRLVNNQSELRAVVTELSLPQSLPGPLRRLLGRYLKTAFFCWPREWPRTMSLQQFVEGRPCNRAVVCWKGKVLAGVTVDVLATAYLFGPATVGKVIDHPDVALAAEAIVAKLRLSGFVGFDFVLDHANKAWFLEMNLRATPTCHLCPPGQDLAGSFFSQITGRSPRANNPIMKYKIFSLFPAKAPNANTSNAIIWDDVPKDEPDYINACRMQTRKNAFKRLLART